jgi:hypothetical protein
MFLKNNRFEKSLNAAYVTVNSAVDLSGSTFKSAVSLNGSSIAYSLLLGSKAVFEAGVKLNGAKIGMNLEMQSTTFAGQVDLSACTVDGELVLGASDGDTATWKDGSSLSLYNAHADRLQHWWKHLDSNAWPRKYWLRGFTYNRLGPICHDKEAAREVESCIEWLSRDWDGGWGVSYQPYVHLANYFLSIDEASKGTDILYAARERRRRLAWATTDGREQPKDRDWLLALGLGLLKVTTGYGLGTRYFRALWWMGTLTAVGALALHYYGTSDTQNWLKLGFATLAGC